MALFSEVSSFHFVLKSSLSALIIDMDFSVKTSCDKVAAVVGVVEGEEPRFMLDLADELPRAYVIMIYETISKRST